MKILHLSIILAVLILAAPMALAQDTTPVLLQSSVAGQQQLTNNLLAKVVENQALIIAQQGEQIGLLKEQNFILKQTYNQGQVPILVPAPPSQ